MSSRRISPPIVMNERRPNGATFHAWLARPPKTNAFVALLELVAILGIVEEVGEVGEQVEAVVEGVAFDARHIRRADCAAIR